MNGIDVQHLQTVHHLPVSMALALEHDEGGKVIDFTLTGDLAKEGLKSRVGQLLLGKKYTYSMRYAHGCLGMLTMMKNVRLIPPLHMLYAYVPLPSGGTRIQPIYVTRKREGLIGWAVSQILLLLTRISYYALRDEDGKIYDNIQFNPSNLLPVDEPLVEYMRYVNQLERSRWSDHNTRRLDHLPHPIPTEGYANNCAQDAPSQKATV